MTKNPKRMCIRNISFNYWRIDWPRFPVGWALRENSDWMKAQEIWRCGGKYGENVVESGLGNFFSFFDIIMNISTMKTSLSKNQVFTHMAWTGNHDYQFNSNNTITRTTKVWRWPARKCVFFFLIKKTKTKKVIAVTFRPGLYGCNQTSQVLEIISFRG